MQNQHPELWRANSQWWQTVLYCTEQLGVTIGAEAGMTVYGQCWGQINSTQCSPLNVCKVFCMSEVLQLTLQWQRVCLLGKPWAVCLQYAAWQPASSSQPERPIACLPSGKVIAGSGATVTGAVHMA